MPPPRVQREIVRVLDVFTELEAELGAERVGSASASVRALPRLRSCVLARTSRWVPLGELAAIGTGNSDRKDAALTAAIRSMCVRRT